MASGWADKDKGWKKIREQMAKTIASSLVIGIQGDAAQALHGESGATVAEIATVHEFGSLDGSIPERSFIRATLDEQAKSYRVLSRQLAGRLLERAITPAQALGLYGQRVVADIRLRIRNRIAPELTEKTIQRKGSDVPLIDKGQLLGAITYEIRE